MMTPWASIERLVRKLLDEERAHAAAIEGRVADLAQKVAQQPTAKDLRELRQAMRALTPADDRQVLDELSRLAASQRPIIVGPWTGELGFELLYWIPFVQWARSQWGIAPERQLIVSRGGVAAWYGHDETRYADVFSCLTPEEFRDAVAEEKRKQRRLTTLDEQILKQVAAQRGGGDVEYLHPRFMYRLFTPYWNDEAGFARIERFSRYGRLGVPAGDLPEGLPAEYAAVRFYFSECFPDTTDNRAFIQGIVRALAEQTNVVLLNPGFSVDEHEDWRAPSGHHRIHEIRDIVTPERNLAVQSAVISRARAFVGTYGGYSYLAPMYGVPAIAFYSRATFKRHHLYAAQRVLEQIGGGALTVMDVAQAPLLGATLAGAAAGEFVRTPHA